MLQRFRSNLLGERRDLVERVSDNLRDGVIDSPDTYRVALGPDVDERALWAMIATFYDLKQKTKAWHKMRHPWDVAFSALYRNAYSVPPLVSTISLVHDNPEDVLDSAQKRTGIKPIVAAYVMLDILADIVSEDVAYGSPLATRVSYRGRDRNLPRFGGVYSLTNFESLVAGEIAKKVPDNKEFYSLEERGPPRPNAAFSGREFVYLTEAGKREFISRLERKYGNLRLTQDEILKAYDFIESRFGDFVSFISEKGVEGAEEIKDMANGFLQIIGRKKSQDDIFTTKSLEERLELHKSDVIMAIMENERQADYDMVPKGQSHPAATIEKTLYGAYLGRIFKTIRELPIQVISGPDQSYINPAIGKLMDLAENASLLIPHDLENSTSINRKAKLATTESIETIKYLRKNGAPQQTVHTLYQAANFTLQRLTDSILTERDTFRERSIKQSAYKTHLEVFEKLYERLQGYKAALESAYGSSTIMGRLREATAMTLGL